MCASKREPCVLDRKNETIFIVVIVHSKQRNFQTNVVRRTASTFSRSVSKKKETSQLVESHKRATKLQEMFKRAGTARTGHAYSKCVNQYLTVQARASECLSPQNFARCYINGGEV